MKRVVSVSLGASERDQASTMTLLGEPILLERRGTDGSLQTAAEIIAELDGQVDAIGLGGIDRYLMVAGRRYEIQDARVLAEAAKSTPVVDGSGLKDTLERRVVRDLDAEGLIAANQSVLMVSAMDRFGMAETFDALGYSLVLGDLIFSSHINYPIRSSAELAEMARKILPELAKMPFHQLYPLGEEQLQVGDTRYQNYFEGADIIAGDFHYIRRHMPAYLGDKLILTNTTTPHDVELLRDRGVRRLITTTPVLEERSFGTNVLEAALVAVTGVTPDDPGWADVVQRVEAKASVRDITS